MADGFDIIGFLECGLHERRISWMQGLLEEALGSGWAVQHHDAYVVAVRTSVVQIVKVCL